MCLFTCPDNASLKCKNTITDGGGTAPQWYHQKYCHHHHHWKRAHIFRWVWPLLEKLPFPICPNGSPCSLDLRWWWIKFLVHFWTIWPLFVCPETFVQGPFIVFTCIAIGQSVSRQRSQWQAYRRARSPHCSVDSSGLEIGERFKFNVQWYHVDFSDDKQVKITRGTTQVTWVQ